MPRPQRRQDAIRRNRHSLCHPTAPIDPVEARQEARKAKKLARRKHMTFKHCAMAYIEAHRGEWKNIKHGQQWENTLASYAFPVFGDLRKADKSHARFSAERNF